MKENVNPASSLAPLRLRPLPLGRVRSTGWLREQLRVQAAGLSGHLDEFWPDVRDSAWIGGTAEGWERGPYWLDGIIPLAFLLDDERLKQKARRWVDAILDGQHEDGWWGPVEGNPDAGSQNKPYEVWPRMVVLKALTQWHEATGDERVVPAMVRLLRLLTTLLDEYPLFEWGRSRWAELVVSIHWLCDRVPAESDWLLELAAKVRAQGLDWIALPDRFPYTGKTTVAMIHAWREEHGLWINDDFNFTHGVNAAMGLKSGGVWGRQSGDADDVRASHRLLALLDEHHGQPNGMFSCDEHLAGRHPSQGAELCAVVELMFSLEVLWSVTGDGAWAERLERVAYNALPATFKPDMWAHQYVQQVNQIACRSCEPRIYADNGPDANIYGLEPNFGCCLANMHQGWPKFAASLWMADDEGGLTCASLAPCDVDTTLGSTRVRISVGGSYPFDGNVTIRVEADPPTRFPLRLAIPDWADGATIRVGGDTRQPAPGSLAQVEREWASSTEVRVHLPMRFRTEPAGFDSISVHRGPLLFAVNIPETWEKLRGEEPTADWQVMPKGAWNVVPRIDMGQLDLLDAALVEADASRLNAAAPFAPDRAPLRLTLPATVEDRWQTEFHAAAAPPAEVHAMPVSGEAVEVDLMPYGCTNLRLAALPPVKGTATSQSDRPV